MEEKYAGMIKLNKMQGLIEHASTTKMLYSSLHLEGGYRKELIPLIKPEMYS